MLQNNSENVKGFWKLLTLQNIEFSEKYISSMLV